MTDLTLEKPAITLSDEQIQAMEKALVWLKDFDLNKTKRPYFVIEGFAGTGKSFTISKIIEESGRKPAFMAYTGKAALVLNKYSDVGATTIHSRIYRVNKVPDDVFKALYADRDGAKSEAEAKEVQKQIDELMRPKFELNPEAFDEGNVSVIVLDECSMVDDVILQDLISYGIPIIALGDPGQLPPVKGEGALFKGIADARLVEIRRQALDNPIIAWSMQARKGQQLRMNYPDEWDTLLAAKVSLGSVGVSVRADMFKHHDITICWKNETRRKINRWARKVLGINTTNSLYPVPGDTINFSKNDKEMNIFNGMFAEVIKVGELMDKYLEVEVMLETQKPDTPPTKLKLLRACFEEYVNPDAMKQLSPWDFRGNQQADFGYAITCHRAQGSQWDSVLIFEENVFNWNKPGIPELRAQWLYTAITRAAKKVTILSGVYSDVS